MSRLEMLMESLRVMGLGMLGIFIFMSVFYLMIIALNKLMPPKGE
ncbi:MAG: hypothetical protein ACOZCL_16620 [Bacillota bacterium]